jgi:ribosomal protein L44E
MEQVTYVSQKELTAQNQLLSRSWIWITPRNVWIYSRFCKRKNTSSFKIFKMKKYNNFSNYKSNKSSRVKKIQSSSWISFRGNKEPTRKVFLRWTSISKSNYRIWKIFNNLKLYKNNNLTIKKHLEYSRWMN